MKIDNILDESPKISPKEYSPLSLAFIGDAVYELYVRCSISGSKIAPAGKLHKEAVRYVKAHSQAESVKAILKCLTEEELSVFKRGRNAKSATVPKNADMTDYRLATGFEALIGYLYLEGKTERLTEICKMAMSAVSE
ncbi:MAG: Mini-ribonuclease 3 [Ruminococcaceae bacterium]|nr:Mini-ribonuclease 3 [Oscillospiraceae bacterium]